MNLFKNIATPFFALSITCSTVLFGNQANKLDDLHAIHAIFENRYAPKEWKESYLGWDLILQHQEAQTKIASKPALTIPEYHRVINDYLRSMQDYHVGCRFNSTEYSTLPFSVKSSEGRYFVYSIKKSMLNPEIFKIKVGDEVVSFNDVPLSEIGKNIFDRIERGNHDTDMALADPHITNRGAYYGLDTPEGFVLVNLIDKDSGLPKSYQMIWKKEPELYTFHRDVPAKTKKFIQREPVMIAADWILDLGTKNGKNHLESKKSDLPPLGRVVWKNDADKIFQAYIFQTVSGENIGFLRIPTFMPESDDYKEEIDELAEIIAKFEESTTKLVLDQTNNGGGSLFYMYGVVSFFANEPLKCATEKLLMDPELVAGFRYELKYLEQAKDEKTASELLENLIPGMDFSFQYLEMVKHFLKSVIADWESGKTMSEPVYFYGFDRINPNAKTVYTKPILLLVNELDFSCADFFPAMLQDNKRAVLMGNRTAGAGGAVLKHRINSLQGISAVSYTWSIGERSGSPVPIENLGITPDIEYKTTPEDLRNGFKEYKAAILKVLQEM